MTAALEEQLRANPDDIHAWQVFADYLIEQGDARGALFRTPRRWTTQEITKWRGIVPPKAIKRWMHGFIVEIELPYDGNTPHTLGAILDDPQARLVGSLCLRHAYYSTDDKFHVALDHDRRRRTDSTILDDLLALDLRRFRRLAFQGCNLGVGSLVMLGGFAGPLVALDLRHDKLGDEGIGELVASPLLDGLRELHLQRNGITEAGARLLADCAKLADLETLDLRFNKIGFEGVRALASSPHVGRLARLLFYPDDIGGAPGVQALATSPTLPRAARRYWSARA